MIHALTFYLFAAIAVLSALMVVTSRNPVHSVLWLILAFFNGAGLFVLMGAEFVAMLVVVVYVGAVAVLFLFVVMMLDINFLSLREGLLRYLPIGAAIAIVLTAEVVALFLDWSIAPDAMTLRAAPTPDIAQVTNTKALGDLIYTHYVFLFQVAGLILFVAMIGAIVLTLRVNPNVRRQTIGAQVSRPKSEILAVEKVRSRGGI
ncbi:NADH-quinone oxidoreductase subunit J [Roseospira marina]|uniref:NADH-quinone oxidoreductase subunit J n=1 Tax=Roseospira marina TaxID=140057 RepID=A0A5M6I919_9PROT|nr:NADH-quinone oxidoreductase subunit J [Roseospira marina]KAA5604764.1 NADH-quinone oxidoreductase subunit J [Roseospira marina]MBB4313445.1 NADH-quinone oxidoreductase subunit J [Roseospira marina]MBB5086607.1 NADH-quinone oxidoreductase subunit J [Roseospira marina]